MSIFDEIGVPDPTKPKKTVFDEIGVKAPEKQPAPPVQETIGDYARRFARGAASAFGTIPGAMIERMGGQPTLREAGQRMEEVAKNLGGGMSPGGKAVDESTFLGGEGEIFGPYPIRKALSAATESAPGMIQLAAVGRAAAAPLAQAQVGEKVAGALTKIGAPKFVGKVAGEAAESAPYWIGEGLQAGGEAAADVGKRMRDPNQTPTDRMAQTDAFQAAMNESLRSNPGLTSEQHIAAVRETLAKQASNQVFDATAASTGGIGALTGAGALGVWNRRLNNVGPQDGILRNVVSSMIREGPVEEAPQSAGEQLISNYVTRKFANPEQSLTENVGEAAALGAATGAAMGGGMAAATHPFTRRNEQPLAPPADPGGPLGAGVLAGQQSGAIPTNPIGGPVDAGPAAPGAVETGQAGPADEKSAALQELAATVAKIPEGTTIPDESAVGQQVSAAVEKAATSGASMDEIASTAQTGAAPPPSPFQQRGAWESLPEVEQFISQARRQTPGIEAKPVQREDGKFSFALPNEPEFSLPDARQSPQNVAQVEKQNDQLLKRAEGLTKRLAKAQDTVKKARAAGDEGLAQRAKMIADKLGQQLDAAMVKIEGGENVGAAGVSGTGTGVGAGVPQGVGGPAGGSGATGASVDGGSGVDPAVPGAPGVAPVVSATPGGVAGNGGGAGPVASPVVLQNRDRSGAASVAQMAAIAADPDPARLSFSREFGSGAPVVFANADAPQIAPEQFGGENVVVDADGRQIPVRYAVVEASDLVPSNRADGTPNDLYTDSETPGLIRAVAGNGRVAGIQQAFAQGTAGRYVEGIAADASLHGVDPAVIARMSNPVLVRMMRSGDITPDIGDRSNVSGVSQLNPVEQARTDMARVNLEGLEFDESGAPTPDAVRRFVQGMPASEQSGLMTADGAPGRQAVDRLMAATFAKAYDDDALIQLYAQAADPEARNVLAAMAQAAGAMARLEGAGIYDVRPVVVDAANAVVNAARVGTSLARLAQQGDIAMSPDAVRVMRFFAANARSPKKMAEGLRNLADAFYNEANKADADMFGAVPRRAPADLYGVIDGQETAAQPATDQQPGGLAVPRTGTQGQAAPEDGRGTAQDGRRDRGQGSDEQAFGLVAPTPEDVVRQQEAAARNEETAAEARARIDREREAADQVGFLQPTENGQERADTTGDMFGGPTADDVLAQRQRERSAAPEPGGMFAPEQLGMVEPSKLEPVRFASGLSRLGDLMNGGRAAGGLEKRGIGVDVGELSNNALDALASAIVNWRTRVFVDSGAFGVFRRGLKIGDVQPLDFDAILAKYDRLLTAIEDANTAEETDYPRPLLVMPDVVGDQRASLDLVARYKTWITTAAHSTLSRPIVPIQKGELSMAQAYREVVATLGTDNFIVGVPSNEAAVTPAELRDFLKEVQPRAIHILGAASGKTLLPRLRSINEAGLDGKIEVTSDASPVRSQLLNAVAKGEERGAALQRILNDGTDPATRREAQRTADIKPAGQDVTAKAARRTRPKGMIEFKNPIVGASGAKLNNYQWVWQLDESVDERGEERIRRISDWDKAELNTETGRMIVHQFGVTLPDGDGKVVSAETAISLLGFGDKKAGQQPFRSAQSAAQTLARWMMRQAEAEQAQTAYEKARSEVMSGAMPEVTKTTEMVDEAPKASPKLKRPPVEYTVWKMGDAEMSLQTEYVTRRREEEQRGLLRDRWIDKRLAERGWPTGSKESISNALAAAKKNLDREQKKLDALVGQEAAPTTEQEQAAAPQGVDQAELEEIVEAFNDAQRRMVEDEENVTHIFDAPKNDEIVRLEQKVRVQVGKSGWMTPAEAKKEIARWKDHAAKQGETGANSDKVVLSLFDLSGEWSQPWADAGYQVFQFDIQSDPEFGDVNNFSTEFFNDMFGSFDGMDVYAVLAACPCTDFAVSGARHFAAKDADGRTVQSVQLAHQTLATIEYFKPAVWAIENPVGRIEKLGGLPPWRLSFNPNHLGDPYTKKTLLWGRFNADLPIAPVEPTEGSKMWSKYGGKSEATKNARSVTPEGFSYGFFMANNATDHPVMAVANKYDRLDRAAVKAALDAGVTPAEIDELVGDLYYFSLDDAGANKALRAAAVARKKGESIKSDDEIDDADDMDLTIEQQRARDRKWVEKRNREAVERLDALVAAGKTPDGFAFAGPSIFVGSLEFAELGGFKFGDIVKAKGIKEQATVRKLYLTDPRKNDPGVSRAAILLADGRMETNRDIAELTLVKRATPDAGLIAESPKVPYASLNGVTVDLKVLVEDSGEVATLRLDAGEAMRELDAREDAARALKECL